VSLLGAYDKMATIGGAIAADTYGAASLRYGRARDHLLGFRAVNGFGESYKAGGKVVKNVTGFDLPKLMCGSMGTLGPLTEVTLRVFPMPQRATVFEIAVPTFPEAVRVMHRIWTSPLEPTALCYVPEWAARALSGLKGDTVLVRLEGSPAHLDEQRGILHALTGGRDASECEDGNAFIAALGDGTPFLSGTLGVWRIAIAPSRASSFIAELDPPAWYADRGGGLLWAGTNSSVHDLAARHQAHAIQVRPGDNAVANAMPFPPELPARAALTRTVKAAFDPLGLFNPGRMYEGV
jgi:glycolate oxidase FAD binding subunit